MEKLQNICENFFSKFWVSFDEVHIQEEHENIYRVTLKTQDSHLIIGPHWKNLEYFWNILKLIFSKKLDKYVHIHLEVNDYLKEKDAKLFRFIDSKIDFVKSKWKEIALPQLSAYERKKIHSYIADKKTNVYTESRWEWKDRKMYICIKHEKMTIDLDSDSI